MAGSTSPDGEWLLESLLVLLNGMRCVSMNVFYCVLINRDSTLFSSCLDENRGEGTWVTVSWCFFDCFLLVFLSLLWYWLLPGWLVWKGPIVFCCSYSRKPMSLLIWSDTFVARVPLSIVLSCSSDGASPSRSQLLNPFGSSLPANLLCLSFGERFRPALSATYPKSVVMGLGIPVALGEYITLSLSG